MASVPLNLTLIREDFANPRSLNQIKASMAAAPTDYVMVVGKDDIVDISGTLEGDVHYMATHVATWRAHRFSKPVFDVVDPVELIQFNCLGSPILHQSMVPLFPETAVEPWHTVIVRAQSQGAGISRVLGNHTIIEAWPRPDRSGAYPQYQYSFDPVAVMEAVPAILVEEINQQPVYSLRSPRADTITAFCHSCSTDFIASLAGLNVSVQTLLEWDYDRIRTCESTYVAWFDSIAEDACEDILDQLVLALAFPGVVTASPYLLTEITPKTYARTPFSRMGGIIRGFSSDAWMMRTRELDPTPPSTGYSNTQAILRKIS